MSQLPIMEVSPTYIHPVEVGTGLNQTGSLQEEHPQYLEDDRNCVPRTQLPVQDYKKHESVLQERGNRRNLQFRPRITFDRTEIRALHPTDFCPDCVIEDVPLIMTEDTLDDASKPSTIPYDDNNTGSSVTPSSARSWCDSAAIQKCILEISSL